MPAFRSIRARKRRRRIDMTFELQLTSMLDVMVIILVFLLKTYSASNTSFESVAGLEMPVSHTQEIPKDSLHLIITPEAITFENERIVEFVQSAENLADDLGEAHAKYRFNTRDLDENGLRVLPLYDALLKAKDKSELLRAKSGQTAPLFDGVLAIQADKRIQYDTLRKVMYTAGSAGYTVFRLLARKAE